MSCVGLAGEASFSTLNIRRRGQTAPKVESGAFQLFGTQRWAGGRPKWGGGPAWRARDAQRAAVECKGSSGGTGTVATSAQPARSGDRRRRCDGRSRRGGRRVVVGPGRPFTVGRADHGSAHDPQVRLRQVAGFRQSVRQHDAGPAGSGSAGPTRPGFAGSGPRTRTRAAISRCPAGWADCCRPGREFLVDSAVRRGATARAGTQHRRDCPLLARTHRCEPLASDKSWRPEPHLRRADRSSSSHLGRDVPSALLRLADS